MKTTTKIIGLLLLTPFGLNSQQNAQASITFEAYIDTTFASEGSSNKINYIDLSKKETKAIDEYLEIFITDSIDAEYCSIISDVYLLSDFKTVNNYIKSNNEYLKPYMEGNNYNPNYIKGTKSFLTSTENWYYLNGRLTKENITSGISKPVFGNNDKFRGHMTIYTKFIKQKSIKGNLFKENVNYDFLFYPYVMDKETEKCLSDCKYTDDVRKMITQATSERINGLSQFEIKSLLTPILVDIYSSRLILYDLKDKEITSNYIDTVFSFQKLVNQIDENGEYIKDPKGNKKQEIVNVSYKLTDIIGISFTEDWYLAKNQFDIIKEVKSISFLVNDYNEEGEIISTKQLPFTIKF